MKLQRAWISPVFLLLFAGLMGCGQSPLVVDDPVPQEDESGSVVDEEKPVAGQPEPTGEEPKAITVEAADKVTATDSPAVRTAPPKLVVEHSDDCSRVREIRGDAPEPFDVTERSIRQIHAAIERGDLTCRRLVDTYLKRIAVYDQPTGLNSILLVNPNARTRADQLDREFKRTGQLLPLHGVAVIVKDNYDTRDLPTTAGSVALRGSFPPDDAFQIRKLRDSGAIILAKSNMAEFAYSPVFTVSSIGGITRNPYDLGRVPAGSSGGTAAAVAASFGTIGLGTDTGNSIRGPSSHTSLVGLRPTLGLTSRDGIIPLFLRNDVGGPMCRTVEDAARVMDVIAGFDPADPITAKSKSRVPPTYLDYLNADGLNGARIGILETLCDQESADKEVQELFRESVNVLRAAGAKIIESVDIPEVKQIQEELWIDTFRHDIEQYLNSLGKTAPFTSLEEIVDSGRFDRSVANRLSDSLRAKIPADLKAPYSADPADDPKRQELRTRVLRIMDERNVDALIYPTWNNPPRQIGDLSSPDGNNSFFIPPHTGQPAITVPMGFTKGGLPVGLQLLGRPFSEPILLKLAFAYERRTNHRRPPKRFPAIGDQD